MLLRMRSTRGGRAIGNAVSIAFAFVSFGCGADTAWRTPGEARLAHTPGEVISDRGGWQWHSPSEDEFLRVLNASSLSQTAPALPSDAADTREMQSLLDRIDSAVRAKDATRSLVVPRPVARVYESEDVNGFVSGGSVCVDLGPRTDVKADDGLTLVLSLNESDSGSWVRAAGCAWSADRALVTEFLAAFAPASKECHVTLEGEGVRIDGTCPENLTRGKPTPIVLTRLGYVATFNRISFTTGTLRLLDADQKAAVVAHELGHYYRSHVTAPANEFDFFYRLDAKNPTTKPLRDATLEPLGRRLLTYGSRLASPPVPVGIDDPGIIGLQSGLSTLWKERDACRDKTNEAECRASCTRFSSGMEDKAELVWPFVTGGDTSEAAQDAYMEVDSAFRSCVAFLSYGEGEGASFTRKEMRELVPFFLLKEFDARPPGGALDDLRLWIDGGLAVQASAFEEGARERLGHYTVEQEADELSLELLAAIGVDPGAARRLLFDDFERYAKAIGRDSVYATEVGYGACKALAEAGWKDARGADAFVPIADFADSHHTLCFRIFNLDREIEAHGGFPGDSATTTLLGAD